MIPTTNPRTGERTDTALAPTPPDEVAAIAALASAAAPELVALGGAWRADLLDAIADLITARSTELAEVADSETGLGIARLQGEVARSAFQFSLFAEAVREGSYLELMIDHAALTPLGQGPDVRRMLVPIGPVAVFGSSNFPFAFSVLGGDTASSLAAGCPVVLKAHGSHPLTSALSFEVLSAAAATAGAPHGTVGIVYGQRAGVDLVTRPEIRAVGFTGSLGAATALREAIDGREQPIPFFGELSSINPLVITPAAAAARGGAIANGLFASFTASAGQLCTKPGIAFVPEGQPGDDLVAELARLTAETAAMVLLNERISGAFADISSRLGSAGGDVLASGAAPTGEGFTVSPTLLSADVAELGPDLAEECFGPLLVVARYRSMDEVAASFGRIPSSLTATIHLEDDDTDALSVVEGAMRDNAGRLVFNGFPTGVRVSWAQNHGGPWPATNSQHTSVGVSAVRRFLRPVAWQDAPQWALPAELRDDATGLPRRIDGALVVP